MVQPIGKLFVFEGRNRVGKTTLARLFTEHLHTKQIKCEYFAFPGRIVGTLGEHVYRLHHRSKESGITSIHPTSLQMLHVSAHIDEIETRIRPALMSGAHVLLDRFWWSTWVYGEVLGADSNALLAMIEIERLYWSDIKPAAIFLVERDFQEEEEVKAFQNQVAQKYQQLTNQQKDQQEIRLLDNTGTIEAALEAICNAAIPHLEEAPIAITLASTCVKQCDLFSEEDAEPNDSTNVTSPQLLLRLPPARPTKVYETYWRFAAERQEIFFKRLDRKCLRWTDDPILSVYKFTNAYRASDRVSQFLIQNVIYSGDQTPREVFFRVLLFKFFNRIETWQLLKSELGAPSIQQYAFESYDRVLSEAINSGERIYSAAYIMPSGGRASTVHGRKHRMHLRLLEKMLKESLPEKIEASKTMKEAFEMLKEYPTIGDFLAYQYITDLNYSSWLKFNEASFVVPGPGARSGIQKCFSDLGGRSEAQIIELVAGHQHEHLKSLGIEFKSLWGRDLQLIDCQNLFCEVDKYTRVLYPEIVGRTGRTRIKQRHVPHSDPIAYWYPPKWGLNKLLPKNILPSDAPHL